MRRTLIAVLLVALAGAWPSQAAQPPTRLVLRFVDRTRLAHFRNGTTGPRTLVTYVRVPGAGSGPYPLVVFAHGFALTPGTYSLLLDAWARAGFVVAAPLFPVERAGAPGGPDESDLANQPADVRFVITRLLASPRLRGLVDPRRIAIAGHSDGAETAYAVAYERGYRDPRVRAAVVLSGAVMPGGRVEGGPPLLAAQGTSDPINPPAATTLLFRDAGRPKFLLSLLGGSHLPPYTTDRAELAVVERTTIAFLERYLGHGSLDALVRAARAPGVTRLTADP